MKFYYKISAAFHKLNKSLKYKSNQHIYHEVFVKPSSKKLIVEVIGTPGIGKSTYIKQLAKALKLKRTYVKEISSTKNELSLWEKAYLLNRIESMTTSYDLAKINRVKKKILLDQSLRMHLKGIYLLDEGLFYGGQFSRLIEADKYELENVFDQRIIIHLTSHIPEKILNQIHYRKQTTGKFLDMHKDLSEQDLVHKIDAGLKSYQKIAGLYEKSGLSVLTLNTDEDLEANITKVIKSIESFLQK